MNPLDTDRGPVDGVFSVRTPPGQRWIVAHTKSRQEKALCVELLAYGIDHYLPTIRELRTHGNRKRWIDSPLFAGYVFARGGEDLGPLLRRTDRVAGIIEVFDQDQFAHELEQIDRAIRGGASFSPYPRLKEGFPARIARGPLKGVEGVIDRAGSPTRLILVVQTLGRATSIEVNPGDVEPLDC